MATLILTAAGQALGGAAGGLFGLGGLGGLLGKAAGAIAGSVVDQSLFGSSRTVERGRLADLSVQSSNEGASLPRVYGRVRLSGQVVWATRFEEEVSEETHGGKGGGGGGTRTTVRSYSYYASFAVALCEGPVSRLGRIWADGKPLDVSRLSIRFYSGSHDQQADPLIAARQGETPAYRGTAYVVFDRLALEPFGNRLPQLSFEVIRAVETLEPKVRAVTLIPGAGEFVYQPTAVSATPLPGVTESLNRHIPDAASDWAAALDDLQAFCPNLEEVALVVAWFGDDLRAGQCTIRPKVEETLKVTSGATWTVSGLSRAEALPVSRIEGRPAYGGTPSDASVVAAIRDLKARGLKVLLYPFLLMDIVTGNGLSDPHGGSEQPAYPWRGRIVPEADTALDVTAFLGAAQPVDFAISGDAVTYSGPEDWGFRRHILHMAHLAEAAGGVDGFLIGSELRGLTRARTTGGDYPFVAGLISLAEDVRSVLRTGTEISYAADWSEYGAHRVGPGELRFPLDPLWASSAIDFVGIDAYLPLTDMRADGDPDGNQDPHDRQLLRAGISGGEYFDWFYASEGDRRSGSRTPIADGAYGKPWVYRAKDLAGWWSSLHHERAEGIEATEPTGWTPGAKPIRFTELGIPAIDKGTNQPNVFVDLKSAESARPHFSDGSRNDLIQRRALEVWLDAMDPSGPEFLAAANPVSPLDGRRMIEPCRMYLWTWDARPYPAFPRYVDVWSDGANWQVGHWLNGRLGGLSVSGFLRVVLEDFGISAADVSVGSLDGTLEGIAVAGPVSARDIIEPLLTAFGGIASDRGTVLRLENAGSCADLLLSQSDLADPGEGRPLLTRTRSQESELASEVRLAAEDATADFRRRVAASRRLEVGSRQIEKLDLGAATAPHVLQRAADRRLARIWSERERVEFALSPHRIDVEPGDVLELAGVPGQQFAPPLKLRVEAIEDAGARRVEAARLSSSAAPSTAMPDQPGEPFRSIDTGLPHSFLMDLPPLTEDEPGAPLRIVAFARPWPGSLSLMRSATGTGFDPLATVDRPAAVGRLVTALASGPVGVWDRGTTIEVELFGGLLQSRDPLAVLSGGNLMAVRSSSGHFEVLQFVNADLTGPRVWKLSTLLRGQAGTEPENFSGALAGADVVLLDAASVPLVPLGGDQMARQFHYRLVPAGHGLEDPETLAFEHTASGRGARPRAPVHLKARRTEAGILISFIRQTRQGGDNWEQADIPLGEEREAYEVDILDPSDGVLRTLASETPVVLYAADLELADFGAPVSSLTFSVSQLSVLVGRGFSTKATRNV